MTATSDRRKYVEDLALRVHRQYVYNLWHRHSIKIDPRVSIQILAGLTIELAYSYEPTKLWDYKESKPILDACRELEKEIYSQPSQRNKSETELS